MNGVLEIQELAIVVTAKNYDPSLLNPGFLKHSGVVPEDWELSGQPVVNNRGSQIVFSNGVYVGAQPNRLMFVEALNNKEDKSIAEAPGLASRYTEILRNLEYQAVGVNFRGYITCNSLTGEANNYFFDHLIKSGEWQNCGSEPVKAGLNLMFTYEDKQLHLSINEATLKLPESEQVPIILFSGNFDRDLSSETAGERLAKLESSINSWQKDLEIYTDVVSKITAQKFAEQSHAEPEAVPA
ncbi:hypothetical protein Xen7305DRAFT_00030970 [Xenococcus sp. PCC 7305]|uniref:hypothetical protein n=1 Tax=Xenococcus sp. PCC 7305 TaxID=102125 RepID=UPI0002AC76AE|nr:hypothetical protein [Xenococcus sp. PCC 7305]ELS03375.1 hypothetical protein Xen7305DRAFT_00030970 [Xenococcus sp. PCC 7305]